MKIYKSWTDLKSLSNNKRLEFQYNETSILYTIFIEEGGLIYYTELWKDTSFISGLDISQNTIDIQDFETNYKSDCNKSINPKTEDGKNIIRAESRPLNTTTVFTGKADDTEIGDGKELKWDFSNSEDDIQQSGDNFKRKRLEFKFLDTVWIKEGTIYIFNKLKGSYLDLKIVCPTGEYYYDNEGIPHQATEDTVICHYVRNHWLQGDVPMGDELNTESCSTGIPNTYKFWLEITVPSTDESSNGHISIELYRERTIVL